MSKLTGVVMHVWQVRSNKCKRGWDDSSVEDNTLVASQNYRLLSFVLLILQTASRRFNHQS